MTKSGWKLKDHQNTLEELEERKKNISLMEIDNIRETHTHTQNKHPHHYLQT